MLTESARSRLILLLMFIAWSGDSFAQSGTIAGVVRDTNGRVVPGVTVTTIPQSGGIIRQTTGGSDGSYRFDRLPDGVYRVDFELLGFELVRRNHVRARPDTAVSIDVELRVRAICECITREPASPWTQRPGQVIDTTGRPLPHARVQAAAEVLITDGEGRFFVRAPVNDRLTLTAADTGFRTVTQEVSGADAATVVLSLEYIGTTGVPEIQRFGGCECPGPHLFPVNQR